MTISENNVQVNDLGMEFAQQYYTALSREPARLPSFYTKNATLLHGNEGDLELPVSVGTEAIQGVLAKNPFTGCRFIIQNIDCHPSLNGGIMINVLGQVQQGKSTLPSGTRSFTQSFFLVEQPSGYFVLNDNMRLLQAFVSNISVPAAAGTTAATASTTTPAAATEPAKVEVKPVEEVKPVQEVKEVKEVPTAQSADKPVKKVTTKAAAAAKASKSAESSAPASPTTSEELPPSGPSSWAQLAAVQQSKWASGVVAPAKGTSIVETPAVALKKREPVAPLKQQSRPVSNVGPSYNTSANSNSDNPAPVKKIPFVPEAALYVTGVTDAVKTESLRSAFAALGALAHFDVYRKNAAAFVEYVDPIIAKCVLEDGNITVDGVKLTVEKRRVNNNNSRKENDFNRTTRRRSNQAA